MAEPYVADVVWEKNQTGDVPPVVSFHDDGRVIMPSRIGQTYSSDPRGGVRPRYCLPGEVESCLVVLGYKETSYIAYPLDREKQVVRISAFLVDGHIVIPADDDSKVTSRQEQDELHIIITPVP